MFSPAAGCVKNVYIWHHFNIPKTQIFLVYGGLCKKCVYMASFDFKKQQMFFVCGGLYKKCVYIAPFSPPQKTQFFPPAPGCVKNPLFSHKNFACGGPKLMTPLPIALPQNMYNQQKNHVFKSDNKMCPYGIILGKKNKKLKI